MLTQVGALGSYFAAAILLRATGTFRSHLPSAVSAHHEDGHTDGILIAAWGKSAQLPFQFWLPDAMVAPTPISAYLHAASMVKVGVYILGPRLD